MTTLTSVEQGLPATWYHDAAHYARELERIWYRSWVCVGRTTELGRTGEFLLHRTGDQAVIVTRAEDGSLHAFHNTCRHRGAELCNASRGTFPRGRIVCPYHSWTYDLRGDLTATPHRLPSADFDPRRYGLYRVPVATWRGFVFIHLDSLPALTVEERLAGEAVTLANWPLEQLALAHRETHVLACNWKVFWENFSECYHCPRVHPELCRLVPMYGRAVTSARDDPARDAASAPSGSPLAPGAVTWTLDGQSTLPRFRGLTQAEQEAGMTFVTLLPTMFIVAHVDYVRSVRVRPLGAEQTELTVDWLLPPETLADPSLDLERVTALGRLVVEQDGLVCEVNQRGLHSRAHEAGVLVAQEHGVYELHRWLRERLAAP
jgi:Rieske 2Fe-2S family protein